MAEIGIASGIAGLISLALQVTATLTEYVTAVKDKSTNTKELKDELELLGEVLSKLKDFLAVEQSKGRSFDEHSVLKKAVRDCTARIERIGDKLKPSESNRAGRAWERFTWPFKQEDVIRMVENLRRFTSIFQFAVTLEGCNMVSRTSEEATKGLKETLEKLNVSSATLAAVGLSVQAISEQMERVEQIITLVPILDETSAGIREMSHGMRLAEDRELRRRTTEILDWLCPLSTLQKHRNIQDKRTAGTGQWFLQHLVFLEWVESHQARHDLLAIGRPGVGKSVLSSIVFDHLRHICKGRDTIAVVFYYWDYADQQAQTPLNFATSLLRQLAGCCNSMPTVVAEFYERTRNDIKDQTWFQELQVVLQRVIATFSQCFFVVDALDETEAGVQRDGLFEVLNAVRAAKGSTKIFATSRPHLANIEDGFQDVTTIEVNADEDDLRVHLGKMIDQHPTARAFMDDNLKTEILDKLSGNAHGIFLLPALQIRNVLRHVTRSGVRRALKNLSTELNQVFESTIDRIRALESEQTDVAFSALMWLSHAKRALTVDEVQHALAVRLEDDMLDMDNIVPLTTIVDCCCGLVEVVERPPGLDDLPQASKSPLIRLVHASLEEYLRSHKHGIFNNGDLKISKICLKYMGYNSLKLLASKNRSDFHKEVTKLALLDYSCLEWGHHAQSVNSEEIKDLALPLLNSGRSLLVIARVRDLRTPDFRKWRQRMDVWAFAGGGGISLASSFGLTDLVRSLISQASQPVLDARNMYGSTPLHEAARLGHENIAELLIAHGADLLDQNRGKNTPVFLAVGAKQVSMVQTLLKYGRDQLDIGCKDGWTPLHKAADLGDDTMVTLLLQSGALIAATDDREMTPLHLAAKRGHLEVVRLLVLAGAVVHLKATDSLTPLDYATTVGHTEVVRFLVANDGRLDYKAEDAWTPIHRAARGGHSYVVAVLLERKVELLCPDHKGNIPLFLAVRSGRKEVVSMILESRPEIRQDQLFHRDRKGATPREVALYTANYDIHKYLRAAEHEFFSMGLNPAASLTDAIEQGSVSAVLQMIEANPGDIDHLDEDRQPPLHVAIQEGQEEIAELILNYGASIESSGYHGWRPLHIAASRGSLPMVELCLNRRANINSLTASLQTPLHKACSSTSTDVVRRLLAAGADPAAQNDRGMTALLVAAHHNKVDVVRLLILEYNVNILSADKFGDTAASWAEKSGHLELLAFLRAQRKRTKTYGTRDS